MQKLLLDCYKLVVLDVRNNELDADLKDLLMVVKEQCPGLRKLMIEGATKNSETKSVAAYSEFVFRMVSARFFFYFRGEELNEKRRMYGVVDCCLFYFILFYFFLVMLSCPIWKVSKMSTIPLRHLITFCHFKISTKNIARKPTSCMEVK